METTEPVQRFIGEVSIVKQKLFLEILFQKQILTQTQTQYQQSQNNHKEDQDRAQQILKPLKQHLQKINSKLSKKQDEFKKICKIQLDSQVQIARCKYSQQVAQKRLQTYEQITQEIKNTKSSIQEKNSQKGQNQKQFELKSNILQAIKENMQKESQLKELIGQNKHFQNQLKTLESQKIDILEIKKQYQRSVKEKNQTIQRNIQQIDQQKMDVQILISQTQEQIKAKKSNIKQLVNEKNNILQSIKKITEDNQNKSQNKAKPEMIFGRSQSEVRNNQESYVFNNEGYSQILERVQNVDSIKCQIQTKWSEQLEKKRIQILLLIIATVIILLIKI